jgi:DNA-binding NtrC family response regulator
MPQEQKKHIVIVSPKTNISENLDAFFSKHDFCCRVISSEQWLKQPHPDSTNLLLFLFTDITQIQPLLPRLIEHNCPRLGVFATPPTDWKDEYVHCFDEFIGWPCHEKELLLRLKKIQVEDTNPNLRLDEEKLLEEFSHLNLLGKSKTFIDTLKLIKKVSRYDASTLIFGETGTGKEIAARAIHYLGGRRNAPFIAVNCGAIPDDLIENELFGHKKGAFTDAHNNQPGMVELANGGTLFLDEVDSLSSKAQVTLLRLIQEREYRPLGSNELCNADIRIIAASNKDLHQSVTDGNFREDLLFRLNVIMFTMPPLRDRKHDIGILSDYILKQLSQQYSHPLRRLHPETLDNMKSHSWPGNVRELENLLHRQFILCDQPLLKFDIGTPAMRERRKIAYDRRTTNFIKGSFAHAKAEVITNFEQTYLNHLLDLSKGNVSDAARRAGKERRAIGRLLKKHNINAKQFKPVTP